MVDDDGTPYGMGGDWCAWCGADWKDEHAVGCSRPETLPCYLCGAPVTLSDVRIVAVCDDHH